jgi:hypothetical protein
MLLVILADARLFFTRVRKIAIFDGSRADDRWLDTSANPGSFPGVRRLPDAPSASGVAFHQYSEFDVPLSYHGLCSRYLSFVISLAIGYRLLAVR